MPHVGVAVRVRLDAPQLDFLVRAAGREESVGGLKITESTGSFPCHSTYNVFTFIPTTATARATRASL